ncbi:MAG TPA: 4-vinyl reductase [Chloroflexia bacterium]|nr:4-vinyl reductase [Chloroflexia bacterium]
MSTTAKRAVLGDFMSVTCFQYLRNGAEDIAGRVPIVAAGRQRGADLVASLELQNSTQDVSAITAQLQAALGAEGTRLCLLDSVTVKPSGGYEVRLHEGACTAGAQAAEPVCAYTLGVFVGAISALTGRRLHGTETQCAAVAGEHCIYQIDPL